MRQECAGCGRKFTSHLSGMFNMYRVYKGIMKRGQVLTYCGHRDCQAGALVSGTPGNEGG